MQEISELVVQTKELQKSSKEENALRVYRHDADQRLCDNEVKISLKISKKEVWCLYRSLE